MTYSGITDSPGVTGSVTPPPPAWIVDSGLLADAYDLARAAHGE